jgi:hypothetical protein
MLCDWSVCAPLRHACSVRYDVSSRSAGTGPANRKKPRRSQHRNDANGEDIISVQIIASILHFLALNVPQWRRGRRRAVGERIERRPIHATNSKICTSTHTGRAEFLPKAVVAGGGAFWRVVLSK